MQRDLVVAIRNRVGLDDDRVAEHALHREPAAVDRGRTSSITTRRRPSAGSVTPVPRSRCAATTMPSGGSVSDSE